MKKVLKLTKYGLYCEAGGFYIDPWRAVDKAIITHAHSDHARTGCRKYLAAEQSGDLLKLRLGSNINLQTARYGEVLVINGVKVSLHPAGHILGSAQVRIEQDGEVWVVSGDFKTEQDSTCTTFELVKCHTFITESTFALPIYKWCSQKIIYSEINNWWRKNSSNKITSIIYGYSLGKAQRIIAGLDSSIGNIYTHKAVEDFNSCYRNSGIELPETKKIESVQDKSLFNNAIIVAPPSSDTTLFANKLNIISTAFASGWMQIRKNKKRGNTDKSFTLSDHADWDGLLNTIKGTGAEQVWVTHGYSNVLVKWLNENGTNAADLNTLVDSLNEEEYEV
jgi:putative mRNA 3-end processing factor